MTPTSISDPVAGTVWATGQHSPAVQRRDRYVPDGDRWVFEHRYVRTDGTSPGGWAESRQKG